MPKQNLVRDRTKEQADLFAANVEKYIRLRGKSPGEVAAAMGLSDRVFAYRRQSPKSFSLQEMLRLMDYLKFSEADRAEVVGVKIKIYAVGGAEN